MPLITCDRNNLIIIDRCLGIEDKTRDACVRQTPSISVTRQGSMIDEEAMVKLTKPILHCPNDDHWHEPER
jgi:hypothetical protein